MKSDLLSDRISPVRLKFHFRTIGVKELIKVIIQDEKSFRITCQLLTKFIQQTYLDLK